MRGIARIAWRGFVRRKARYALTAIGIVLGVGNVFGVLLLNATTNHTVAQQGLNVENFGDIAVNGTTDNGVLARSDIDALSRLPGVKRVKAYGPQLALRLPPDDPKLEQRRPGIYLASGNLATLEVGPRLHFVKGRMLHDGAPEVVLTDVAAKALHKTVGDLVTIAHSPGEPAPPATARGVIGPFTVVGIISERVPGDSFTSLEYIWSRTRVPTALVAYVFLSRHDADTFVGRYGSRFPALRFQTLAAPPEFRRFLSVLQGAMSGAAAVAVFVGAFLIYLTFSMSVVERTRMFGTIHAIGGTQRQVTRLVLTEAITVGSIATLAGLGLGFGLAHVLEPIASGVVRVPLNGISVTPSAVLISVAVGLVATLAGSIVPALRAGRATPVEAIRGQHATATRPSRMWIAGVPLVIIGIVVALTERGIQAPSIFSQSAVLALLFGSVLLLPPIVGPLARITSSWTTRRTRGLGDVAVKHVVRERSHAAYTLGLVMVVLAMMLSLAAASASVGREIDTWVNKRFGASLIGYSAAIPPKAFDLVRAVPGVAAAEGAYYGQGALVRPQSQQLNLIFVSSHWFRVASFPWADGSDRAGARILRHPDELLLPSNTAREIGVRRGDKITLSTVHGARAFTVVATYATLAQGGEVGAVLGPGAVASFFREPRPPNVMYINFTRTASFARTRDAVDRAIASHRFPLEHRAPTRAPNGWIGRSGYFFISGAQIKAQARRQTNAYFGLFYTVLFIAVIVGLLGLANTMATGVVRRFREIGILQAVGAEPKHVRRMVVGETSLLVAVAFVLSLALGTVLSRLIVGGIGSIGGSTIPYVFPWVWMPALAVLAIVIALIAAAAPARRASRLTPVEALRYE